MKICYSEFKQRYELRWVPEVAASRRATEVSACVRPSRGSNAVVAALVHFPDARQIVNIISYIIYFEN